ncbi:MAG TPA: imidazole glycerol phosphate synthase subunit HisH [Puia sp.]|nr:imidazole glycerol phosphate synthase subunit HisH [Puia sp.]
MIAILDYGIGNVSSIKNMFKKVGVAATITSDPAAIGSAEKIILPGVGNFDYCMKQLRNAPFFELFTRRALEEKVPVLGVCVGCQMLMESSEEGNEKGLGWIRGKVVRFDSSKASEPIRIPHMGWTDVRPKENKGIYAGTQDPRYYFVHSYHLVCDDPRDISATARYGYEFVASVEHGSVTGVQFHPEKSHKFGMQLYKNFVNEY